MQKGVEKADLFAIQFFCSNRIQLYLSCSHMKRVKIILFKTSFTNTPHHHMRQNRPSFPHRENLGHEKSSFCCLFYQFAKSNGGISKSERIRSVDFSLF